MLLNDKELLDALEGAANILNPSSLDALRSHLSSMHEKSHRIIKNRDLWKRRYTGLNNELKLLKGKKK